MPKRWPASTLEVPTQPPMNAARAASNPASVPSARRRYDASRLACDHRLKIYGREKKGFDDLGFDDWSSNSQHRLHPERRGALGHCPHIARKSEFRQVLEELARYLLEGRMFAQIIDVSVTKSQRRKIVERLLESGDNQVSSMPGKPAGE